MRIDPAAWPFVALAALPALAVVWISAPAAGLLLLVPAGVALFFRDPDRHPPQDPDAVLAPADGTVMHAGPARPAESPPGAWLQVTIFLYVLDVHINRAPVGGTVTGVEFRPGSYLPAFQPDAHRNEQSEIWLDAGGESVVVRQVVGVLARRVVCRVAPGDRLQAGDRIGLMKFGSRMDVFVPVTARVVTRAGARVRAGETVIARLARGAR
jgi:phosphatidylserine decarboxylase